MPRVLEWFFIVSSTVGFSFAPSLLIAAPVEHPLPQEITAQKCWPRALAVLARWKAQNEWLPRFTENAKHTVLTASTSTPGTWVEIHGKEGRIEVARIDGRTQTVFTYNEDCLPILTTRVLEPFDTGGFSDKSLHRVLQDSEKSASRGLIYLWSPHMPLSERGLAEAREWCKSRNMNLVEVIEPIFASDDNHLTSRDLIRRGLNLHYPSVLFFSEGRILGGTIPGYKTSEALTHLAQMRGLKF